jgi:HEAT repeat protein
MVDAVIPFLRADLEAFLARKCLIPALAAQDGKIRQAAIYALVRMGGPCVPVLVEALGDRTPDVQLHAALTLALIGPEAKSAVPSLVRVVKSTPRAGAEIFALGTIKGEAALDCLIEVLRTSADRNKRSAALTALESFGPGAKRASPFVVDVLLRESPDWFPLGSNFAGPDILYDAQMALVGIGPGALPSILPHVLDERCERRLDLLTVITLWSGRHRSDSGKGKLLPRTAVEQLQSLRHDKDKKVREQVIHILRQYGAE